MKNTQILIFDYGSQYTQLLARRIRELNVLAEVIDYKTSLSEVKKYKDLKGIILSGGPDSVYEKNSYSIDSKTFDLDIPILGVCYGMQLITQKFGGIVEISAKQEFGKSTLTIDDVNSKLFLNVNKESQVWMSHADHISKLPVDFSKIAHSENSIAAIKHNKKEIYGVQFHLEVTNTVFGIKMLDNFIFKICKAEKNWFIDSFIENEIKNIKEQVGDQQVILGLSGGVDSSVAAALISKAINKQLTCIFIDTGLLRKNEAVQVLKSYDNFDMNIKCVDASKLFYDNLKSITDPEDKRKKIGKLFVDVFNQQAKLMKKNVTFLAQGTIYPDIIESSKQGHSSKTIKSHHNVGGLPKDLNFKLIEPLKTLFKDEVRLVGNKLGIDSNIINRHPFPGPGLGIRVIGEVTKEKCDLLREIDDIFINELKTNNLYNSVSQAFATLLPVKTVGVMGDNRTYEFLASLRCVNTIDFMTATSTHLPWEFLDKVVNRIINEVKGVNRVVYDITSKPPGTIEWE